MMKKWLILLIMAVLLAGAAGFYMYNKPHRDIAAESADFVIDASALLKEFETDENAANQKYLDKIIAVKGKVSAIETTSEGMVNIALETGNEMAAVSCSMLPSENKKAAEIKAGDNITVKGLCTGILMDVVLTKCTFQ
jgi:hypothetical protein